MIKLYTDKNLLSGKLVNDNEGWFCDKTMNLKDFPDIEGIKKVEAFEMAKYNDKFLLWETEFGTSTHSQLSTGAKTLLNIIHNKDVVFDLAGCGDNAIKEIFKIDDRTVYSEFVVMLDELYLPIIVNDSIILDTYEKYLEWRFENDTQGTVD